MKTWYFRPTFTHTTTFIICKFYRTPKQKTPKVRLWIQVIQTFTALVQQGLITVSNSEVSLNCRKVQKEKFWLKQKYSTSAFILKCNFAVSLSLFKLLLLSTFWNSAAFQKQKKQAKPKNQPSTVLGDKFIFHLKYPIYSKFTHCKWIGKSSELLTLESAVSQLCFVLQPVTFIPPQESPLGTPAEIVQISQGWEQ